ncbi:hypothetical protein OROHE_016718 [Orobanche hederae]
MEGCRVVTLEEARRLMKIGPKRSSGKGDNNPPIYKEDVERAGEEQTKDYVAMALDHYNATTEGPKYELVEAIGVNGNSPYWVMVSCLLYRQTSLHCY